MSAIWAAWSPDWSLYDKVDFDGINRIVYVHPEVTEFDIRSDLYTSWIDWVSLRDNLKFSAVMRTTGLDPIGGGVYTGDIYFLTNGWKLSINLQKVKVNGVLYSDDYDTPFYTEQMEPSYPVKVAALVTTLKTEGAAFTVDDIWNYLLSNASPGTAGEKLKQALTTGNFLALK